MSEERSTPAPIENLRHEAQSRPFTSFYISDILGESPDRTRQLVSGERTPLEENGTAEGINEPNLIDNAEQECSKTKRDVERRSSSTTPQSEKDENSFSNLKSRSPFLAEQREILEKIFQESKYISSCKRKQLASELKLTERQIKTWFQNRRTKFRKVRGSDGLRRQDTWNAEHAGVSRVLSNIDGGINGLPKDWVLTLYKLLSKS